MTSSKNNHKHKGGGGLDKGSAAAIRCVVNALFFSLRLTLSIHLRPHQSNTPIHTYLPHMHSPRRRKVLRDNIQGVTNAAIRRLGRRAGVKRLSGLMYEETRGVMLVFLENTLKEALTYTEHRRGTKRRTNDVLQALKHQGRTLYGVET
jgi:histone H4